MRALPTKQDKPIQINSALLRARKTELRTTSEKLVKTTKTSWSTVSDFFAGAETLNLQTIKKLASELGLGVIVDFRPIDQEER